MTCQKCQDEATFHLTRTVEGAVHEVHLCAACARQSGLIRSSSPQILKLDVVLQALITSHVGEHVGELAHAACDCCGTRFMQFRTEGRLGCPCDYEKFARGLAPILRQFHGASRHVGKRIVHAAIDPRPLLKLRAKLRNAVSREDFELAARLRDQLRDAVRNPNS